MEKIAVISGASSGIGKETALLLAKSGYRVFGLNRTASDISGVEFVKTDITDNESIKSAIAYIAAKVGRIDLLVNNAGMGISGSIEHTPSERAAYIFDVNFFGAFELTKAALPHMKKSGGRIINVSSLAAVIYLPFQGFYSATKAAVNLLFSALQLEVKPFGISVTNVMPGDIKTGFTSNRRKNEDDEGDYAERIKKSVAVMEKDEQRGMPPSAVAACILKQAKARKPRLNVAVGGKYKIIAFLAKILPSGLINKLIYAIYGG
ncbi:MAG: SDR family NAD(P)-dependent oxidoreductase [Clostridia bacterium]|nr:SDR family NAD(P)-dependent oxidoreductase [Clostridia bacterium]